MKRGKEPSRCALQSARDDGQNVFGDGRCPRTRRLADQSLVVSCIVSGAALSWLVRVMGASHA